MKKTDESKNALIQRLKDETDFFQKLCKAQSHLVVAFEIFESLNKKWLLDDDGNYDNEKLAQSSYLLGDEWLNINQKLIEVSTWAAKRIHDYSKAGKDAFDEFNKRQKRGE